MAPTPYKRTFSFTGSVSANPNFVPAAFGVGVDAELDQVGATIAALGASLAQIQRADGALANGIVTLDSMATGLLATFQSYVAASAASASQAAASNASAANFASSAGYAATVAAASSTAATNAANTAGANALQTGKDVVSTGQNVAAAQSAQAGAAAASAAAGTARDQAVAANTAAQAAELQAQQYASQIAASVSTAAGQANQATTAAQGAVTSANTAAQSASVAVAARQSASAWASQQTGQINDGVNPAGYSAYYWAQQALSNATATTIPDGSVSTRKLANGAVTTAILAAGAAVGNIGAGTLTAAMLASGAALSNIGSAGITSTYLAAGTALANLVDGTVPASKLTNASVGTQQIANGAVTTALIANGAVTGPLIAAKAVGTAAIADGAVTDTQVSGLAAGKVAYAQSGGGASRPLSSRLDDIVSVKNYGNVATAIAACNGSNRTLYVPAGNWEIAANTTIGCDVVMESGASFTVDAGVTLTITGNLQAPPRMIFFYGDGASAVKFPRETRTPRVPVEWFGARGVDASGTDAAHGGAYIQRAVEACRQTSIYPGPPVYFSSNTYLLGGYGITLYPSTPVQSEPGAHLEGNGPNDSVTGITLTQGNYAGYTAHLPSIASCSIGLKLDRANLADVDLPFVQNVQMGVQLNVAGETPGAAYSLLDNKVTCQFIQGAQQNAVYVTASQNSDVAQGNEIHINFINGCLRGVLFYGSSNCSPNWDSNKIIVQAIDGGGISGGAGLANISGGYVSRLIFKVETWFGGMAANGLFVSGLFYACRFEFGMNDNCLTYDRWVINGPGNSIRMLDQSDDNAYRQTYNTSPSQGSFNGGIPIDTPGFAIITAPPQSISAFGTYTAYFYSPFVRDHSPHPRVTPIGTNGWVVDSSEPTSVACEIALTLRNVSGGSNSYPSVWRVECGG